jgi:hypothetical protein
MLLSFWEWTMRARKLLWCVIVGSIVPAMSASAAPLLSPTSFYEYAHTNGVNDDNLLAGNASATNGPDTASAQGNGGNPNSVFASGSGSGANQAVAGGAQIIEDFIINGGSAMVPVIFQASLQISGIGMTPDTGFQDVDGSAGFIVTGPGGSGGFDGYIEYAVIGGLGKPEQYTVNETDFVEGGMVYESTITAAAGEYSATDAPISGTANASVDPEIFIDPTFLANNPGYSIEFSPDPTPEPASLSLLASAGIVLLVRRRSTR